MKKELKFYIAGIVTTFVLVFVFATGRVDGPVGSVFSGHEYTSTTTQSTSAATDYVAKSLTGGGTCSLGSVVVASTSATTLTIMNATSSTDTASTTLAIFKPSVGEGTYTFDVTCSRGIVIETPTGFDGVYTVTYK